MAWSKEYYESTWFRLFGLVQKSAEGTILKIQYRTKSKAHVGTILKTTRPSGQIGFEGVFQNCTTVRHSTELYQTEDHNCSWNKFPVWSWNRSDCWFICFGWRGCQAWLLSWWKSFCSIRLVFKWLLRVEQHQSVVNIYLESTTANYGAPDFERLHKEANEETWIIPMIETVQAMGTVL